MRPLPSQTALTEVNAEAINDRGKLLMCRLHARAIRHKEALLAADRDFDALEEWEQISAGGSAAVVAVLTRRDARCYPVRLSLPFAMVRGLAVTHIAQRRRLWQMAQKGLLPIWSRITMKMPPKPEYGQQCNGCGVCCFIQPCAIAQEVIGANQGPCPALEWEGGRSWCGLVRHISRYIPLPDDLAPHKRPWLDEVMGLEIAERLGGVGGCCDSDAPAEPDIVG